jgi:predicted tellurium resistance membrane protein TerC
MGLTYPLFTVMDHEVTGRSLILLLGGIFLIYKSTNEIHHKVAKTEEEQSKSAKRAAYFSILIQIALLDLVFSFDSILTAIGLAKEVIIMVIAVIISILVMMIFTEPVGKLITKYPTLQILALSFLIMIGVTLIMEGLHFEIDKKIVYVSVLFSLSVEMLNIRFRKKSQDG